ncbi:MAG: hypothetical protein ACYDHF_07290 [Candidatus Cryosericum sp.]
MIEEFVQGLQQAEVEAKDIVKAARERVQAIQHDTEASLVAEKTSALLSLQLRLDTIDQGANQQIKLAEDQLQRDLKEQLQSIELVAHGHEDAALNLLLSELTPR